MSTYFMKGKGYRIDFMLNGVRYTQAWFKTKTEAKRAEADKRKEVLEPQKETQTLTDMGFLELVNRRLDHLEAYTSQKHYEDYRYLATKWVHQWGHSKSSDVTPEMIERYVLQRSRMVSPHTANKELRSLRSLFNFGKKKKLVLENPTDDLDYLPVEKKLKHVPSPREIDKLIAVADEETGDYLWAVRETMARVSEINRLTWDDVSFRDRHVVLYTRKKKGGHLTPRKVPMTQKLFEVLSRRHTERDPSKPWVFWHSYWSNKTGETLEGPYKNRRKTLKTLCKKAGVKYSGFHALRHSGASIMENSNVPVGAIQRILGHENRSTTEIYLHTLGDSERQAMVTYEQARENSHTDSHTGPVAA
ncbi:MAG: tyrosine-type recombinase/integrase [Acidobacteria bacterium]|nr:tyrosine-type recombinase/integrase [Acidobacteriota bacterium]